VYVKIRDDGAVGIGRGTEGPYEIAIGYGEAHMIAAALEKLAQTARSYKQTYKKTTDVGRGNKIEFERTEDGDIILKGDGNEYVCTEKEMRELSEVLKHLPPVDIAPPSDYVKKRKPKNGFCLELMNGGQSMPLKLPDAALIKKAIVSSMDGKYYEEKVKIGSRSITVQRTSDLKWNVTGSNATVKFTAYEVESLVAGLHNGILDVLMDAIKKYGGDDLADIRVKSHIQRVEQEAEKILVDEKKAKSIVKHLTKTTRDILGAGKDADERTDIFVELINHIYRELAPEFHAPLFNIMSEILVQK
jgi:hypothetical protein